MNMNPLLKIKNLRISFDNRQVVHGIDLTINKGEIIGLVGESGCGKSATAQAIMRLLPSMNVQGEIEFQNSNLLAKTEKEMTHIRGKNMGMIFQEPMTALNPTMKIGSQISECLLRHAQMTHKQAKQTTIDLLHLVGVADPQKRIDQYPYEFSGGMRQRIMIAIAIACNPDLIIADEPTTALDVTIQAQILELLKDLRKNKGTSILLITHDLGVVAAMCDRVAVMHEGHIVEEASVEQLFYKPKHPYTQTLLRMKCA